MLILVIETQIPTEEDLMEVNSIQFPSPTEIENAVRFNNMTPVVEIPADIIIQRIEIEGPGNILHNYALYTCLLECSIIIIIM